MELLSFPPEIITQILSLLSLKDLYRCEMTCQRLLAHIRESVLLTYVKESQIAGVIDNPSCLLPISEKLAALRQQERAWQTLDLPPPTRIAIPATNPIGSFYELKGGYFFLSAVTEVGLEGAGTFVRYIEFSDPSNLAVGWKEIRLPGSMLDIAVCVEEHDLIALITLDSLQPPTLTTFNYHDQSLSIHFLTMSTGQPHPDARLPVLSLVDVESFPAQPTAKLEIVGDLLALLLTFAGDGLNILDRLFVYNWRTGCLVSRWSAEHKSCSSFAFISHDIILLGDQLKGCFELLHVSSSPNSQSESHPTKLMDTDEAHSEGSSSPIILASLELPRLVDSVRYNPIICRCEPSPLHPVSIPKSKDPFIGDTNRSLVVVQVTVVPNDPLDLGQRYIFVVNVAAILSFCDTLAAISHPPRVCWESWGADHSRWFDCQELAWSGWITATSGARLVRGGERDFISVLDFDSFRVRRDSLFTQSVACDWPEYNAEEMNMATEQNSWPLNNILRSTTSGSPSEPVLDNRNFVLEESVIKAPEFVSGRIYSHLPYIETFSKARYSFEAVLMGGSTLLGLDVDELNDLAYINIFRLSNSEATELL